eukprot:3633281-Prymnesium_polylepis.1
MPTSIPIVSSVPCSLRAFVTHSAKARSSSPAFSSASAASSAALCSVDGGLSARCFAFGRPALSYAARSLSSDRHAYASPSRLKASSAPGSLLRSGWSLSDSARYARLTSSRDASRGTPSTA